MIASESSSRRCHEVWVHVAVALTGRQIGGGGMYQCGRLSRAFPGLPTRALNIQPSWKKRSFLRSGDGIYSTALVSPDVSAPEEKLHLLETRWNRATLQHAGAEGGCSEALREHRRGIYKVSTGTCGSLTANHFSSKYYVWWISLTSCICPIILRPYVCGHHVLKELYRQHSSFCTDVNQLKLKLRLGTLMQRLLFDVTLKVLKLRARRTKNV